MRKAAIFIIVISLLAAAASSADHGMVIRSTPGDDIQMQVFFSPRGGCTAAIVDAIHSAKNEVLVQAYSFTSAFIAKALVDAHKRGVQVQIILDRSQETKQYGSADFTAHAGIPTYIDAAHGIAHNKVMVIDKAVVITGSFNFTKAAETNNAENLLVIRSKVLAKVYCENWERHKEHSVIYEGGSTRILSP